MKISFLELGNGMKISQEPSFGYYKLLLDWLLSKIQSQTITSVNVKYTEHSGPFLSKQEEK